MNKHEVKNKKLLGVELLRGVSIYAVILAHSGDENWGIPISPSAVDFRLHFYFAVPFFLATAFYFMTSKSEIASSPKFWRSRVDRLVIPYVVWSLIFLISRVVIFTLTKKSERLQQLLQDPLSIVFLGGASYHLYFLPLLFTGTFLILLIPTIINRIKIGEYSLVFLPIASIFLYNSLEVSGNAFQLGKNVDFQSLLDFAHLNSEKFPLLRLVLVEISWAIRCLPYFFIALTLNRFLQRSNFLSKKSTIFVWAVAFLLSNFLGKLLLPGVLLEIFLAYTLLLFSLTLSNCLPSNKFANLAISSIGVYSFGIYLIHPFVMNFVKTIVGKIIPTVTASISISSMLLLSILCFLVSWLVVLYFSRNKFVARYLFGA